VKPRLYPDTKNNALLILGRVETRALITSSLTKLVSKTIILIPELRSNTTIPSIIEVISQRSTVDDRPVVPANKVTDEPLTSVVLNSVVGFVGHAPAVSEATVFVVDDLGTLAVETGGVGGVFVTAVA
jgi:hypothetical protein